jgi:hypothetical protein
MTFKIEITIVVKNFLKSIEQFLLQIESQDQTNCWFQSNMFATS